MASVSNRRILLDLPRESSGPIDILVFLDLRNLASSMGVSTCNNRCDTLVRCQGRPPERHVLANVRQVDNGVIEKGSVSFRPDNNRSNIVFIHKKNWVDCQVGVCAFQSLP